MTGNGRSSRAAPTANGIDMDPSSAPLADYFWIAGIDSLSYGQHFRLNAETGEKEINGISSRPLGSTIDENSALETMAAATPARPPHSPRDSLTLDAAIIDAVDNSPRLSRLSDGSRFSIYSENNDMPTTASNRSSATIRAVPANPNALNDDEFDRALRKFATARDSFLDELSSSNGTASSLAGGRSNIYARPSRTNGDDANGTRPGSATVRRRLSLRDLNSMKRQPSVVARTGESSPPPPQTHRN